MCRPASLTMMSLLLVVSNFENLANAADVSFRKVELPCTDRAAIQWVRDPANCAQYYICHFGQPLAMPACPYGQVWGIKARNCVPEDSRWNDCNETGEVPKDITKVPKMNDFESSKKTKPNFYALTVSSPDSIIVSFEPLTSTTPSYPHSSSSSTPVITRSLDIPSPRPSKNYSVYEKDSKKIKTVYGEIGKTGKIKPYPRTDKQEVVKETASPSVASPFQPWSPRSYQMYTFYTQTSSPATSSVTQPATPGPVQSTTVTATSLQTTPAVSTTTSTSTRLVSSAETVTAMTTAATLDLTTASPPTTATSPSERRRLTSPSWSLAPLDGHPCRANPGTLVAYPSNCNWYYNCTVAALVHLDGHVAALEEECRYPQLFDTVTSRCREFINVQCGDRFEPVDPCEYHKLQCRSANCIPCQNRFGTCRGRENGIYPFHTERWTPTFVTCYQQRNIAQDDCQPPTPIFSPEVLDCVSLFDVPKTRGGLRPECGIFFECRGGNFTGYDECPSGTSFDPLTLRCQLLDRATPPCGEGQDPSCTDRHDGFHADPYGRCPYYFECRKQQFVRHLTCDYGSFDPVTQECVIPVELIPQPCGLLPNPCEGRASGFHPDEDSRCRHYIECSRGVMISNGTCPHGTVFSSISGRCDRPENAPAPCGMAPSCEKRADGRYPALTRGCSFYFECKAEKFVGLRQCSFEDGGFFFNEKTSKCDFPQNICPPCGYRWWGW
ncbi:hypothetical protein C0Q70_19846 [Pomacea canaliculata]|uniref:Chitin-binding type-2 domain-containing protein n=1 Tax=Pomacea canaliculata TaxID=400727 RepID=A0A2T7NDV7_POMCA|nr:hypothetical protein C0Q70_19846 [Pomacea canaliculata]